MAGTHSTDKAPAVPTPLRRNLILAVLCLALVAVVGMMASVMVAVPDIAADLGAAEGQLLWIVNAYGITFAGLLLVAGALGDRLGRKAILIAGLLLFAISSAVVVAVDDIGMIIAMRAVAGVGAAAVMPMTLSIITRVFPAGERGRAVGIWSGVTVGGALVGLLTAGALLEIFSWRSIFVFNVVLTGFTLIATVIVPGEGGDGRERVDVGGGLLSMLSVASLVFGMIEGPERGWGSAGIIAAFGLAAVTAAVFVGWELRHPRPLLDPRLFRHGRLASGAVIITSESLAMFGLFFVGLQYLQVIKGYSPFLAALAMMPLAIAAVVFSPVVPKLHTKLGYQSVVVSGMAMIGAGLLVMTTLDADSGYWPIAAGVFLLGAGIAFAATPATEAIMAALPEEKHGVASALNDVTRELGAVLGIALMGSIFSSIYRDRVGAAASQLPPEQARAVGESVTAGVRLGSAPEAPSGLMTGVFDSFQAGMSTALLAGVVVVAAGTAVGHVTGRTRRK
ncbi:MFS transporter [Nocardia speluncae]|uniref:MFS transporter n=1 Tax=Nocardia speluncae TaxID=419477 RepID=A0A846XD12_9NOCA|nr:MFS transporter [Nocardia speluncae]NKY34261.1 MFS transporter [Nocardia speluncae]